MNPMAKWRLRSAARGDAAAGVEADLERLVTALKGPKPRGAGSFEDSLLTERQGRGESFEALNEDVEALDGALATHAPRAAYLLIALVSFAAETGASAAALHVMGYEGLERVMLAFCLSVGTLLIAGAMSRVEARQRASAARWALRAATAGCYFLLVAAAAWLRSTASEESLPFIDIAASAILLGVATGAPAVASHWAFSRLHAAGDLHARRAGARRIRRTAERERKDARGVRVKLERAVAEWEDEAAQIRALYLIELRRAQARLKKT